MVDFSEIAKIFKKKKAFIVNNTKTSFYRNHTVEGGRWLQVRISNHGTMLWSWLNNAKIPPHKSTNISIVFSDNGECFSDTKIGKTGKKGKKTVGGKPIFQIIQYVYDLEQLSNEDIQKIQEAIKKIPIRKEFIDPFANTEKCAEIQILIPNQPITYI